MRPPGKVAPNLRIAHLPRHTLLEVTEAPIHGGELRHCKSVPMGTRDAYTEDGSYGIYAETAPEESLTAQEEVWRIEAEKWMWHSPNTVSEV